MVVGGRLLWPLKMTRAALDSGGHLLVASDALRVMFSWRIVLCLEGVRGDKCVLSSCVNLLASDLPGGSTLACDHRDELKRTAEWHYTCSILHLTNDRTNLRIPGSVPGRSVRRCTGSGVVMASRCVAVLPYTYTGEV